MRAEGFKRRAFPMMGMAAAWPCASQEMEADEGSTPETISSCRRSFVTSTQVTAHPPRAARPPATQTERLASHLVVEISRACMWSSACGLPSHHSVIVSVRLPRMSTVRAPQVAIARNTIAASSAIRRVVHVFFTRCGSASATTGCAPCSSCHDRRAGGPVVWVSTPARRAPFTACIPRWYT